MSAASARGVLVPVGDSVTLRNTVAYVVRQVAGGDTAGDDSPGGETTGDGPPSEDTIGDGPPGESTAGENSPGGETTGDGPPGEVTSADDSPGGDTVGEAGERELHFVFPVAWQSRDLNAEEAGEAEELLDRVRTWVREDLDLADDEAMPLSVTTAVIGTDAYLFSPTDYAETILEYARENGIGHVVLDPEYRPGSQASLLSPLAVEFDLATGITYEQAPVERSVRGRRLIRQPANLGAAATVFGVSFLFYQVIGGFAGPFDYVTGAVSAAIVAAVFSGITFDRGIQPVRALGTLARWVVYVPYLFWQIAKANVEVAYIVLHPSMPIDPSLEEFDPAVPLGFPVTSLANSITLTPGTVTVDVRERNFYVHALTQSARDDLYAGGLERAIRFVFFGRGSARLPSPRERGQTQDHGSGSDTAAAGDAADASPPADDATTGAEPDRREPGGDGS